MKILAISDVHGEDNENLYKYLNNNDIDINGDSPSKLYNGKYITKYIGIPISEVKYN